MLDWKLLGRMLAVSSQLAVTSGIWIFVLLDVQTPSRC